MKKADTKPKANIAPWVWVYSEEGQLLCSPASPIPVGWQARCTPQPGPFPAEPPSPAASHAHLRGIANTQCFIYRPQKLYSTFSRSVTLRMSYKIRKTTGIHHMQEIINHRTFITMNTVRVRPLTVGCHILIFWAALTTHFINQQVITSSANLGSRTLHQKLWIFSKSQTTQESRSSEGKQEHFGFSSEQLWQQCVWRTKIFIIHYLYWPIL